jgi:hypothetical protein
VLGGRSHSCGQKSARLSCGAKEKSAKKCSQNKAKPGAQTRQKWAKNAGSRINEPQPTDDDNNETWQDVPPLVQKNLTRTMEDKNQRGLFCEFINI